jgi:predicted dienelactone hydrolase
MSRILMTCLMFLMLGSSALAQTDNRIDLIRQDAPELAEHGPYDIGVRTLEFVNPDQLDIINAVAGEDIPTYDRPLTVEVWYPAALPTGTEARGEYLVTTRDGTTQATLVGRAVRDAPPHIEEGPYPLIIISHGYPGNRFLLSHLGENLATKGYVTVSIDHTDSTYSDQGAFGSTLLNRSLDQLFVLNEVARLATSGSGSFLEGLADADTTGLIGYSMGGYGVINTIGGGFSAESVALPYAPPNNALAVRQAGTEAYLESLDDRIKAAIAIAPWGMQRAFWDEEGLAGIEIPLMIMAGSADDVSDYERGIRAIYDAAVNAERYLLTFENANHNAAAPIPAPNEVWENETFGHYADPVWDTVRMNNIAQHFATAFFDLYLKGDEGKAAYLALVERAQDGVWSVDDAGAFTSEHTYWHGFPERTAAGLVLEQQDPTP